MADSLERRQEQRYAVLKHIFDRSDLAETFRAYKIASTLPYPEQEIELALTYLAGEHLADAVETYHGGSRGYKLTHQGIKEVERSLQKPEEPTEHFSLQIIQNFNAPVGAVQTGPHATANVTQNIGAGLSDVFSLLEQLKLQVSELPQEQQEDASVSIEALEYELKLQDKNPKRIRAAFAGLRGIKDAVIFSSQVTTLAQQLKDLNVF